MLSTEEAEEPLLYPVRKEGVDDATLITIGRTKGSDIVLDSPAISKLHAYFSKDPISGEYTIADAGSTNGTEVQGRPLKKGLRRELQAGDQLSLGDIEATFHTPESFYELLQDFPLEP